MSRRKKGIKLEKQFPMHEATHKDVESHELAGENVDPVELLAEPPPPGGYWREVTSIVSTLLPCGPGETLVLPDDVSIDDLVDVRRHNDQMIEVLRWELSAEWVAE